MAAYNIISSSSSSTLFQAQRPVAKQGNAVTIRKKQQKENKKN
jgi:hypothetical protein